MLIVTRRAFAETWVTLYLFVLLARDDTDGKVLARDVSSRASTFPSKSERAFLVAFLVGEWGWIPGALYQHLLRVLAVLVVPHESVNASKQARERENTYTYNKTSSALICWLFPTPSYVDQLQPCCDRRPQLRQ